MAPHDGRTKSPGLRHRVSEIFRKSSPALPSPEAPPVPPVPVSLSITPKLQQQSFGQQTYGGLTGALVAGNSAQRRERKPQNEHQAGAGPRENPFEPSPILSTHATLKKPATSTQPAPVMPSNPPPSQEQPDTAVAVEQAPKGRVFPVEKDDSAQDSASRLAVQKMLANLSGYMYKPMYEENHLRTKPSCEKPELMAYDKNRLERQREEEQKRFRERLEIAKSNVGTLHDSSSDDEGVLLNFDPLEPQDDTLSVTTVLHCPPERSTLPEEPKLPEDYGNRSKAAKKRARQKANKKKDVLLGEKAPGAGVARDVPILVGWPAGVRVPEQLKTPDGRDETFSNSHAVKVVERRSVTTELSSGGRQIVLRSHGPSAAASSSSSVSASKIPRPRTQSALSSTRSAKSDGSTSTVIPLHKRPTRSERYSSPLRFKGLPLPEFDSDEDIKDDDDEQVTPAILNPSTPRLSLAKDAVPDEFTKLLASDLVHPWPDLWEHHKDVQHNFFVVYEDADAYEQIRQLLIDVWMALTGQKKATQPVTDIFAAMLPDIPKPKRTSTSFNDRKRSSKDTSFDDKRVSGSSAAMTAFGTPRTPYESQKDSPLGSLAVKSPLEDRLSFGSNKNSLTSSFETRSSSNGQRNSGQSVFSPNHIIAGRKDSVQRNSGQSATSAANYIDSRNKNTSPRNSDQSTVDTSHRLASGQTNVNQRSSGQRKIATPNRFISGQKNINQRYSDQKAVATQGQVVSSDSTVSTPSRVASGQTNVSQGSSGQSTAAASYPFVPGPKRSGQRNSGQHATSTPNRPATVRKGTTSSAASAKSSYQNSIDVAKTRGIPAGNLKSRKPNLSIRTTKSTADLKSLDENRAVSASRETPTPTKRSRLASLGNLFTPKKSPMTPRGSVGDEYFATTPADAPPMPMLPPAFARSTSQVSEIEFTLDSALFGRSTSPMSGNPRASSISFSSSANTSNSTDLASSKKDFKKEKETAKAKAKAAMKKGKAMQSESGIDPAIFEELLEELIVAFIHWHSSNSPTSFPLTGLAVQAARALVAYTSATLDSLQDGDKAWDEAEQFNARLTWIADNPSRPIHDCPIPKLPEMDSEYVHAGHADVWAQRFLAWAEEQDELCCFIERDTAAAAVNDDKNEYDYYDKIDDDNSSTTSTTADGDCSARLRPKKFRPCYAVHGGMGARCEDLKRRLDWCEIDPTLGTCIDKDAVVTPFIIEAAEAAGEGRPLAPLVARQRFEKLIAEVGDDARWAVCVEQIARLAGLVGRDGVAAMEAKRLVTVWQEQRAIEKAEREKMERKKRQENMMRRMMVGMGRKGIAPKKSLSNLKIRSGEEAKREMEAQKEMERQEKERRIEEKRRSAEMEEKKNAARQERERRAEKEKKDATSKAREAKSKSKKN